MGIIETLDESVLHRRHEVASDVADAFRSSVRAILVSKDGGRPEIVGSCFLLGVDEYRFVVTAAHVLDNLDDRAVYVAGTSGTQPVQLLGLAHLTAKPEGSRSADKIDIGFWQLESDMVEKLGAVSFISAGDVSRNMAPPEHRLYLTMGFPVSKNKKNVDQRAMTVRTSLATYTGELDSTAEIRERFGAPDGQHLFLKFHKFSQSADGAKQTTFAPRGLSGGPLIDLGNFANPETYYAGASAKGRLAGMIISRMRADSILVATRIEVIVKAIRAQIGRR